MKNRNITCAIILSVLVCFAFLPETQAVEPAAPDTALANGNTADGNLALAGLTTGFYNSAFGVYSLLSNGTASFNTGVGAGALLSNTANENTAIGAGALLSNTTSVGNTANGAFALFSNSTGGGNTAVGDRALFNNTAGLANVAVGFEALFQNGNSHNIAVGSQALFANVSGLENTAVGDQALLGNTQGFFNVAVGGAALISNTAGNDNVAVGGGALNNTTGNDNTAIGFQAGIFATTGSNNVYIGSGISGVAGESNACYIASIFGQTIDPATATIVGIDANNKLGTISSSKRFKEDIKPMDKASEAILALKPVTFHYKSDSKATPQFGLIAEEVAKVNPSLVVRDKSGEILTVHYDQVNAMLLNEFLKEHRKVEEQQACISELTSRVAEQDAIIAQQQNGMDAVTTQLREQAAQIQKVSAQVELSKPAPTVVLSNP